MRQAPTSMPTTNQIRGLLKRSTFGAPHVCTLSWMKYFHHAGRAFNVRSLAEIVQQDELLTGRILGSVGYLLLWPIHPSEI